MFMSRGMFDDTAPANTTQFSSTASSLIRPVSSSQSASNNNNTATILASPSSTTSALGGTFSSSQSLNLQSYDGEGQALTPAMRRAKMEEVRLQQLGKKKGRMLVPTVTAKSDNSRPGTASSLVGLSSASGGSGGSRPGTAGAGGRLGSAGTIGGMSGGGSGGSSHVPFNRSSTLSMLDTTYDGAEEEKTGDGYGTAAANTFSRTSTVTQSGGGAAERVQHPMERDMLAAGISPIFDPTPSRSNAQSSSTVNNPSSTAVSLTNQPSSPFSLTSLSPLSLRLFLTSPSLPQHHHQCYITRNKKGIANRLYPLYECVYEAGEKCIMVGRKKSKNKTSHYVVSSDKDKMDKGDAEMLGKVRSNFVGTEFSVFDHGVSPDKIKEGGKAGGADDGEGGGGSGDGGGSGGAGKKERRAELGSVLYESNILGSRGPRKMTVLVPAVRQTKDGKQQAHVHRPQSTDETDSLLHAYKVQGQGEGRVIALVNKTPKWNEQVGAYVLNFNGRVTMASVKNFQLMVHSGEDGSDDSQQADSGAEEERPCLQFGRVGKDMFTMDFGWPLSPLQAFAICLSSFDYKLACE